MPPLFASLAHTAGATVDAVYSEGFRLEASTAPPSGPGGRPDPNARRIATSARAPFDFDGTYVCEGSVIQVRAPGRDANAVRGLVGEKPMVDVAVSALRRWPERDDAVLRRDTGQRFLVSRVLPADFGRVWIELNAIRSVGQVTP